jgi:dolichyl-phosphate-mannose--protein O-mannosyl transferase
LLCEHRFIHSDGLLHFFACIHFAILLYGLSLKRSTYQFGFWQIMTGISLGAACSCKNTAWGLIALNGIIHGVEILWTYNGLPFNAIYDLTIRGMSIGLPALSVYLFSFAVHFVLLPFSGQGRGYLSAEMQRQLVTKEDVGHQLWGLRVSGSTLIWRAIKLTLIMHTGNMQITQWHPFQSRPIGWPLLTDIRVMFWGSGKQEIACMGNVFSYYFAFAGVCSLVFGFRDERWLLAMRFVVGWAVSYFPFYLIPRTMYLYHYLIPLMIGCLAFGASVDIFIPPFLRGFIVVVAAFLAITGFVMWSPYSYGTTHWDTKVTIWTSNWVTGDRVHRELALQNGAGGALVNTYGIQLMDA